jgi:hypothetical protein
MGRDVQTSLEPRPAIDSYGYPGLPMRLFDRRASIQLFWGITESRGIEDWSESGMPQPSVAIY